MKVELINHTPNPEYHIVSSARICYNSPDDSILNKETGEITLGNKDKKLLAKLLELKHFSTLEHASFTFKISGISRACSHQLVRHRMASYSQRSQRYVNEQHFDYIIPDAIKNSDCLEDYKNIMQLINEKYLEIMEKGVRKEDARYLLPNACSTQVIMTINARSLINFFELRLNVHAQWEIRNLAKNMYIEVNKVAPILFGKKLEEYDVK